MDKKSKLLFHNFRDVFVIYSIPNISIVETSCYEQHFHYHTRENVYHGTWNFSEKIVLLKQLSGSTNNLIMITLNHLVLQNKTRKSVLKTNYVTKPEIPTSDEKE